MTRKEVIGCCTLWLCDYKDLQVAAATNLRGVPRIHRQLWRGICRRGEENIATGARRLHPNQKPVALMDWCLDALGVNDDSVVLDTHFGSGTTALACLRRGIEFIGSDIDPLYFDIAVERLRAAQLELVT